MLDYEKFQHNPTSERIVNAIAAPLGTTELSFFRVHAAYYFCQMASSMRAAYFDPGAHTVSRPINMFAVNLAPSGFGKGYSTYVMEEQVTNQFRDEFLAKTWPIMTTHNLAKTADYRARKNVTDPEDTRMRVEKEFERMGSYEYVFTKPTEASIGQLRNKLLMAGIGAINLQVDEIGANLFKTKDALPSFLELFDGKMKNNLTKNTADSVRAESMYGTTPTNMMLFGVPSALLDQGKNEEEFINMCEMGYARRCFFGYVSDEAYNTYMELLTPEEQLRIAKEADTDNELADISDIFRDLADPLKANVKLPFPDNTALLLFHYKNDCKKRARAMPLPEYIQRYEMEHRHDKARKLAAAYAFIESASQVEVSHLKSAIALTEESGDAFKRIMYRDTPSIKLAKFLGDAPQEMTKMSLRAQLPYFKGGTKQSRDEMLVEAIDWGYTNNISIKRRFSGGVEFYSGAHLKSNNLTKLKISFGQEQAYNYTSQEIGWDKLVKLASVDDINWINHTLENGFDNAGHRHNDNCIPGFNMVVIDVDNTSGDYISIQKARSLMKSYRAFYYTTKRHAADHHRFRIILPINYTLELDADDFSGFMSNLYDWLPFATDEATGQRSRKWLTSKGHHIFNDGALLDALPFIPRTTKQAEYSERLVDLANMGGIERWFIMNTSVMAHNRNNNLLRYGMMLVDGGLDAVGARDRIMALNSQLDKPMTQDELDRSIMKTVTKQIKARTP